MDRSSDEYALYDKMVLLQGEIHSLKQKNLRFSKILIGFGVMSAVLVMVSVTFFLSYGEIRQDGYLDSYLIQNLRGDEMETGAFWRLPDDSTLYVNLIGSERMSTDKVQAIKNAILSEEIIILDDSLLHKGPKGYTSEYFVGWQGVLESLEGSHPSLPRTIKVQESDAENANIVIKVTNLYDSEGLSAFTKSMIDVEAKQILKSTILVYGIDDLSADQLEVIVRHEFGHALGLGHSSAPEDLMHHMIGSAYPYISQCNLDALQSLYGGNNHGKIVCSK